MYNPICIHLQRWRSCLFFFHAFFQCNTVLIRKLVLRFSWHGKVYLAKEYFYQVLIIIRVMLIEWYWMLVIIIVIIRFLQPVEETDYLLHLLSHPLASWGLHCHPSTQIMGQIPLILSTALKLQCQASVKSSISMRLLKALGHQSIK